MQGVIAAGGPETVAAGAEMLKKGGNAVDAAVAAAFASFIAEIGVVHLGGSGIGHVYDPRNGHSRVYDFFSNTPGLAGTAPTTLDFEQVTIDFGATTQSFYLGRASVAVPGNIAGLCQMAADYGRFPLATLLEPAIRLARQGTPIEPFQADTCDLLYPLYTHTEGMRAIFEKNGRIIQPYDTLFIPNLAATLQKMAETGAELARSGSLAQAIIADQQAHGGLLTATDLIQYEVAQYSAIRLPYHQYELLLPPPSSHGGVLAAFALKLMARCHVAQWPHGSATHLQVLFELMTATNRARLLWDKWSETEPIAEAMTHFLSDAFIEPYFQAIQTALRAKRPSAAVPELSTGNNTSHLSVIDSEGMAVSLTTTAGESAGYVVPGTGYIPNNMMGEEDLHPAGFHSRPAGQRIPTMMTPTLVLLDGHMRLAVGSGGSVRIRSAILQVLNNLLDYGLTLENAVNNPRVHVENGVLQCEAGYDPRAVDELESWGYPVNRWDKRSIYFGGAHSVSRTPDGRLTGAGDSRRGGSVAVVDEQG